MPANTFPKLHNAMWPGLVGKEPGSDHPPISLDRMLELTANADVNGQKFEGVDLFLFHPHTDPDASEDDIRRMADKIASNLEQVHARGGKPVLLSDAAGVARLGVKAFATVTMPTVDPFVAPILYAVPVQLMAYHAAVAKGTDVDQPRNLAKSVVVE